MDDTSKDISHYKKPIDRFQKKSKIGRHKISKDIKNEVYTRDNFTCLYCGCKRASVDLTIDHLVPLSLGGIDEIINYVTCCRSCNQRKSNMPLEQFARSINIDIQDLPVHGDPVIDNIALPTQIRLVRKRIFDKMRLGELQISGRSAQKKVEKEYRREFWQTEEGKSLESEFPNLPGHIRIMIPEIRTIAKNSREYLLLVELAKSANTRSLIGSILTSDCDIETRLLTLNTKTNDVGLKKRIEQALNRFGHELRRRNQA
jgi:hypothetical protein